MMFASSVSSSSLPSLDDVAVCEIVGLRLFERLDLLWGDFLRERLIVFFFFDDDVDLLLLLVGTVLALVLVLLVRLLRLDDLLVEVAGNCRRDFRLLLLAVVGALLSFRWRERRLSDCLLLLRRDLDHEVSESESEWDISEVGQDSEADEALASKSSLSLESFAGL